MKRFAVLLVCLLALSLVLGAAGCGSTGGSSSAGQKLYAQAKTAQAGKQYTKAAKLYEQAIPLLVKEGDSKDAADSYARLQDMQLIADTYVKSISEVKADIESLYPGAGASKWAGELERITYDGKIHFFGQAAENLKYRHLELMFQDAKLQAAYPGLIIALDQSAEQPVQAAWNPFQSPINYESTTSVTIARSNLPATGVLKLWWPVPILTAPQTAASVKSITPATYVKQPPTNGGNIGLIYMEVPLQTLTGDLNISVVYDWTHYQQRFTVDPANDGTYDKSSDDYKQYTRSYGNTTITPEIKATAQKVVGGEKNPYLAAKKLYDYVIKDIKYSFMPHLAAWPHSSMRESVYVHQNKRGDCGAQSMYYSALCRSIGIPCRTTGGYQLWAGGQLGDHFWAEFLLPNYGWLPVDVTAAEIGDYPQQGVTAQQRQEFKDFFFANQDAQRCVIQKDVDEPLTPPANGSTMLPMAVQEPAAVCSNMKDSPALFVQQGWKTQTVGLPQ